uniref:Uncharacterized protein n=1 Tax=Anguilla anguilla TaxID=7936 RepID=A0A0E9X898_ANGAN
MQLQGLQKDGIAQWDVTEFVFTILLASLKDYPAFCVLENDSVKHFDQSVPRKCKTIISPLSLVIKPYYFISHLCIMNEKMHNSSQSLPHRQVETFVQGPNFLFSQSVIAAELSLLHNCTPPK